MLEQLARRALQTERLTLRPLAPADAPRLAELANDFEVVKWTGGMPYPYALANAEGFIRRASAADPEREVHFAVDLTGEGPVGCVGFYAHPSPGPELGYWLGRPFWGQGYMTEAVSAALGWAGGAWGKRVLTSGHFADNEPSGRVLTKSCFLYTGEVEPRFSIARGEEAATRMMVWLA